MPKQRIFVVEDDALIAQLLTHLLQREGYEVLHYADGRSAQQAFATAQEAPGLILLDVMLPYVDGFSLVHEVRARWADTPLVMLTSRSQEQEIVRALDAGANDYILKPFQVNELMARLRRFLRQPKPG